MNKIYAILFAIVLFFAIITRVIECLFAAILESRGMSLSFFIEVYANRWSDPQRYTSVSDNWEAVKGFWNETS